MAKKNALISVTRNDENGVLTFNVGKAGSFDVNPSTLPEEVRTRALIHGIVQKVSDAAAMPKSETEGKSENAIAKMKLEAMSAVAGRLAEGDWSKRSGDGSGPVAGIIFRAFSEFVENAATAKKKPVPDAEAIRAVYDAKSRAEQLALRNVPEIAAIMDRIRAERGTAATVDTDALLGDLGL